MRDTRSENAQPLNIKGEVEDEGVMCACVGVHDPMFGQTQSRGSKVRETINRGRSQITNNHVEHPGIVGEA